MGPHKPSSPRARRGQLPVPVWGLPVCLVPTRHLTSMSTASDGVGGGNALTQQAYFCGAIGCIPYVPLFVVATWRTYLSLKEHEYNPLTYKPFFHIAMTLYTFFDLVYLIGLMSTNQVLTGPYLCQAVGLFFNIVAYSTVILFWSKKLPLWSMELQYKTTLIATGSLVTLNFIVLLLFIGFTATAGLQCQGVDGPECIDVFYLELCVDGFSLVLLSVWFLFFGIRLQVRIQNSMPSTAKEIAVRRRTAIITINVVMAACTLCYTLRVVFEIFMADAVSNPEVLLALGASYSISIVWFVLSKWVCYCIPACVLLYLMRPKAAQGGAMLSMFFRGSRANDPALHMSPSMSDIRDSSTVNEMTDNPLNRAQSVDHSEVWDQALDNPGVYTGPSSDIRPSEFVRESESARMTVFQIDGYNVDVGVSGDQLPR
jgi:hypothetical protein